MWKECGSFPRENIEPLIRNDLFSLTRGKDQLFHGVTVLPFQGRTRAMQGVLIDGDPPIFYPADLLPVSAHLNIPYVMAYDIEPLTTLREKKADAGTGGPRRLDALSRTRASRNLW